jgi:CBS domain containing-hemolysin-like protein
MTSTIDDLLLAVFLLAANAFFVAAEFALVKARGFRIDLMAERNQIGAGMVQKILLNIEAHLACCQLGITMASLGLGWVGEPTVAALLGPALAPFHLPPSALHATSFLLGFLIFSSLHIVVGEQVPKTLAIRQPEPVALWIAYPLRGTYLLFYPLNWLLNVTARGILRVLGIREAPHHDVLTDAEIEDLVEVSAEYGKVGAEQAEYIHNVFKFGELKVADVMVHRTNMVTIDADLSPRDMLKAVRETHHSRIPLWRGESENIVGVLHIKHLAHTILEHKGDVANVDIAGLATEAWFVPDTTLLEEQLNAFRERRSHFALVVDEYGALQGLVTLEDILAEIIGEMPDENQQRRPDVRRRPDGTWLVDGSVPVRELNREYDWNLPDDGATTIAGLVIQEAGTIPEPGQRFAFFGFTFEILRRQRNQITALKVTPAARSEAS